MSYIGNTVENQNYVPAIDYFNGDGSTVAFTLSRPVASVAAVQAVISNVPQNPGSAFTVSGSTITFTSAPPSGTANIYVYYTSPNTQVVQPGQGTVGPTQIDGNYALWNKSGSDINYTAGSVGVGTNSMLGKFNTYTSNAGNMANGIAMNNAGGGSGTGDSLTLMAGGTTITQLDWKYTSVFESSLSGRDNILFKTGVSPIERMRIDSSGRVTMPYQPSFRAARSSGDVTASNVIVFNSVFHNTGSAYNSSNGRFTAPVSGLYAFDVYGLCNGAGAAVEARIRINGSDTRDVRQYNAGAGNQSSISGTTYLSLNASDYIDIYMVVGTVYGSGTAYTQFCGYLVG